MNENKKILVTGSNGQLGQCLKDVVNWSSSKENYLFTTREEFDIGNVQMMKNYLNEHNDIKIIINCAAYTDVKGAETEEGFKTAMFVNSECVKNLAKICKEHDIFLIHFGTDYMYDYYKTSAPISEDTIHTSQWEFRDEFFWKYYYANKNKYGYSKCSGIHEIFKQYRFLKNKKFVVIVVSWLYSPYGKNFVKTIRERLKLKETTKVVYTQIGSPTYAIDLAKYIVDVIENDNCNFNRNIINFSNLGVASWYDIAKKVEDIFSLDDKKVLPILETNDNVLRPKYSVLDTSRLLKYKGDKTYVRHWLNALDECCRIIRHNEIIKETD